MPPEETTVESPAQPEGAMPEGLGDGGRKAIEAERKARRDAEARAKELEDRFAGIERDRMVAEIASAKGLPESLARRLTGSSREELEADADELAAALNGAMPTAPSRPPRSTLTNPMADPNDATPPAAAIADQIVGRGRL